jgi:uncharacterized protein (TIGR03083 family)
MTDYFAHIARQRYAVADVLDTLKGDEWGSPSMCEGWRIQEMAAHLTMPFRVSKSKFLWSVVGAGGNIAKVMDSFVRAHSGEPADELIGYLRNNAESRVVPPFLSPAGPLTEIVVHGFDVSIPTGRHVEVPEETSRLVLDYLVSSTPASVYTKRGVANGVRLVSTDSSWSWGEGGVVSGTNFGLIMLLARRPVGFDHVSGEGVDVFRQHLAAK